MPISVEGFMRTPCADQWAGNAPGRGRLCLPYRLPGDFLKGGEPANQAALQSGLQANHQIHRPKNESCVTKTEKLRKVFAHRAVIPQGGDC
ncbi:hypothetical protein D9M71_809390 [compost metagenome]